MPVFRVTTPYLNILVKPRIIFRFSGKYIILCILKGEMPFKMHKIIFFSRKKIIKKICVPTLPKIFRPVTRNTLFLLFGLNSLPANDDMLNYPEYKEFKQNNFTSLIANPTRNFKYLFFTIFIFPWVKAINFQNPELPKFKL